MDAAALKQLLDESQDSIVAGVKAKIIDRVSGNYEYQIAELVQKTIKEFYDADIAPELVKMLAGEKGAIIEASKAAAVTISTKLAENMVQRVIKNMDGYSYREALKALLS